MKNKTILVLAFCIFSNAILLAQRERTVFKHLYYESDGSELPTNHVGAVYEDKDGLIWICTDDGLVRYDSYQFIHYQFDTEDEFSISNNTVNCFLEELNGDCYVGTKIGFNIFDRKKETFKRFLHDPTDNASISHNEVLDVLKSKEGQIFVATIGGVNIFDPISEQFQLLKSNSKSWASNCLLQTQDEQIWVGTENGISLIKNNTFDHYPLFKSGNIPVKVNALFQDDEGLLWVASDNGLYLFDPQMNTYQEVSLGEKFKNIKCNAIVEYPKGRLYIGTYRYGLLHFDIKTGEIIQHYEYLAENRYGISDANVRGLTINRRHDLWISTSGGVNIINPYNQKFTVYDNDVIANSKLNYMRKIYMDSRENIWMNTRQGIYRKAKLNDEAIAVPMPGYKANENFKVSSIWEDKSGTIWMVINNEMLKEVDGFGKFEKILPSSFFNNSDIDEVIVDYDAPDLLWITTSKGICSFNMISRTVKWILPSQYLGGISDNRTRRITQQENGHLWFVSTSNLCVYDPVKDEMNSYLINPADSTSLISSKVEDIIASANRIYIAGDKSFSYFDIDQKRFVNYTSENNDQMKMSGLAAITVADNGEVWFSGKGNVAKFDPLTNAIQFFVTFNLSSGGVKRCAIQRSNGNVLFGTKTGIMEINPYDLPQDTITPTIKISEISIFNRPYTSEIMPYYLNEINLNYYENYFTIGFTGFSYIVKSDLDYLVKMEGIDEDWVELGYVREMEYENMQPGKYVFQAKGVNPDGIETAPLSLAIIIHPPFWETYWFYSMVISIIGFILYLLYSNRKKTILLKKEKKLAEQHAHYKSQFLANMSHEIRTPMNAIMGLNKLLMDSDLNTTQQEYTEAINLSCESLLWIINDILDQAKIESGNLNIKKVSFEIQTISKQINALLHNSIKEKNLYFRMEIDDEIPKIIIGDPIRLFQVLTNLVGNAIKFTKKGGIYLHVFLQEETKDECTLFFEVRDTGIGIPEDKLKKIFKQHRSV